MWCGARSSECVLIVFFSSSSGKPMTQPVGVVKPEDVIKIAATKKPVYMPTEVDDSS